MLIIKSLFCRIQEQIYNCPEFKEDFCFDLRKSQFQAHMYGTI